MLKWTKTASAYVIEVEQGKAVIQEIEQGTAKLYVPLIEANNGTIIANFEHGFDDFETANAFISANIIELDRLGIDDSKFTKQLISTLDICLSSLNEPHRVFHRRRIENIKRWLSHQSTDFNTNDLPQTDWSSNDFIWNKDKDINQVDVSPHGIAIINGKSAANPSKFRIGVSASSYHIQIEDITGIKFVDPVQNYYDFTAAEDRLREILGELEKPFVEEIYVDHLAFTLQICQQLLPTTSEHIHYIRLDYIENYLAEVLP